MIRRLPPGRVTRWSIASIVAVVIGLAPTPALADVTPQDVEEALRAARDVAASLETEQERLDDAKDSLVLLEDRIAAANSEIDQIDRRIALEELSVREQAISLYMTGEQGGPGIGLTGEVLDAAIGAVYAEAAIGDRVLDISTLVFLRADSERLAGGLAVLRFEQELVRDRFEDSAAEILSQLEMANAAYQSVKQQWDTQEAERRRREEEQRRREAAEAAAAAAAAAAAQQPTVPATVPTNLNAKGKTCPVDGAVSFRNTWGAPRPGSRTHKGTDLGAPKGTPLVAVESGVIVQMSNHVAGGLGLYLRGAESGDVYYYAHLQGYAGGISMGVSVGKGQLLGWVGTTGNASAPNLHLGLMPGGFNLSNLVNPYPLLAELCR